MVVEVEVIWNGSARIGSTRRKRPALMSAYGDRARPLELGEAGQRFPDPF